MIDDSNRKGKVSLIYSLSHSSNDESDATAQSLCMGQKKFLKRRYQQKLLDPTSVCVCL